ncbi:hypothetical protein TTRE_0000180701 [Trichuris trichiura]|uniref:Uncharacterized protein n=1 Tax=Trichuris trichiura TaxID=36087 RepID=A0A077YZK7_TRITR|nr:hypothetical protein TTRE_0000180701 [Trichuris trichiura]
MAYTLICMLIIASERRCPLCFGTLASAILAICCLTLSCILLTATTDLDNVSEKVLSLGVKTYFRGAFTYANSAVRGYVDWVFQKIGCCELSDSSSLPFIGTQDDPYIACIEKNGLTVGIMKMPLICYNISIGNYGNRPVMTLQSPSLLKKNSTDSMDEICPNQGSWFTKESDAPALNCLNQLSRENADVKRHANATILMTFSLFMLAVFCLILARNIIDSDMLGPIEKCARKTKKSKPRSNKSQRLEF